MAPRRNNARLNSPAHAGQALDTSLNVDAVPAPPDGSPSSGQANAADAAAQSSAQGAQQAPPQQPAQSADPLTGVHFLQGQKRFWGFHESGLQCNPGTLWTS